MPDYSRLPARFFYRGVCLLPEDAQPDGKSPFASNVRSYQEGTIGTRWGLTKESTGALGGAVHSLFRLNDTSVYGGTNYRFAGVGASLYSGPTVPGAYTLEINGFSGNPLTAVSTSPANTPRSYLYIGDSTQMRKINSGLNDYSIGIPTPITPPTAALGEVQTTYLESVNAGAWVSYGDVTPVGAVPIISRVNTTVTYLLYDSGTTGMASIALDDMAGIVAGLTVTLATESVIIQEVNPPVSSTTIGRILYDVGATGLCTIQPAGSFSVGQIEAPLPDEIRRRYEDLNQPVPPRVTVSRTVDFPVNSLVLLNSSEAVRILSVAIGPDGRQSFRCSTAGTFAAGQNIDGIASFRAYLQTTRSAGDAATDDAVENTLTPPTDTDPVVGGIQAAMTGVERNWGLVGDQAVQPEDIIRFGFKASALSYVQSVRLILDVNKPGGQTFLENYYFYEWRANDLLSAIQATEGAPTGTMADAQAGAVTQGQTDSLYGDQYGQQPVLTTDSPAPPGSPVSHKLSPPTYEVDSEGRLTKEVPYADSFVTAGATPSRQISLGDNQWIPLQCRVADLTRVGTDATRTLSNIGFAAISVQVLGTTDPITLDYADCYLTGGYGPDVGMTLPPYVYRYRFRSTVTGERSNPSPSMRAGVHPHRGLVTVTPGEISAAGQTDVIDWFRFGGALARWQYAGTQANTNGISFDDATSDSEIDGGETLRTDLFQPWPTFDVPRSGVAELAGTSLQRVSGDNFNTGWGADSTIIVNGVATALYRQPTSVSRLEVIDNCGEGATIIWSMPSPRLLAQPLPALWGGPIGNAWFNFACGDPSDPSLLHWTHGNDPDATAYVNTLVVTSSSEPLMNGFFFDGQPYVFSSDRLLRIVPTFGSISAFRCDETPCTKGLWAKWAFALAPEGVYFVGKDGIYLTAAGSDAVSITDPDLSPIFPQDGGASQSIRGINPPDFSQPNKMRLTYVDSGLYFDYVDTTGAYHTLFYEPAYKRWTLDTYASGITARLYEPGQGAYANVVGCLNGNIYQADATKFTDDGTAINWALSPPWANGGDLRSDKQWGDAVIDAVAGDGFTVTPVSANGSVVSTATVIGASAVRTTTIIEIADGEGVWARNFGLQLTGVQTTARPILYLWEPSYLSKQVSVALRATDWENLGYVGAKFVQGVVIRANTYNVAKSVEVQYEGGHVGTTLSLVHDGEVQYAYPIQPGTWTPFVAELVRIIGADSNPWNLLDWRWVWEPAPEAATQWQTQETTFDLPGYLTVRDALIAYQADCPVILTVWHDNDSEDYVLPTTNSLYSRYYQNLVAAKGKWVRFRLTSGSPFRVFARDCSVRVQGWGLPNGYVVAQPFGGVSRQVGALI